ncbi:MAG TPA: TRIC cation channel family protein [Aldersonia sp.]
MDTAVRIPLWIDLAAVAVGAAQGASFSVADDERNEFDVLAGVVFAVVVGLGGGMLRDVLIGVRPAALQTEWYLVTALLAGVAGMVAAHLIHRLRLFVDVLDAAALGLFVVVGVVKANDAGLGPSAQVLLGTITGVGGGVMRDLLAGRPVQIVQRSLPYALIAVLGASGFVVVVLLGGSPPAGAVVAFTLVLALRIVAVAIGWRTPPPPAVRRRTT